MKYIKLAILSFIILFIIVTIFSLFMPSHVQIMKARNMHTQPDSLWSIIEDLNTWEKWNTIIPNIADKDEVQIKWQEQHPVLYVAAIERPGSKPIISGWRVSKEADTDSVMVQWYIDIQLRWYPWEKFAGILYEKSYGEKLSEGLDRLNNLLEN